MSQPLDAEGVAQLATRVGVVEEPVARELLFELDDRKAPAETFVRLMERKGVITPFQGAKLLKGETDGYFLGGYRLLYKIASGSFGRVFRGDDPRSGEVVAVKVLRRRWSEDKRRVELFDREGRLGVTLQHPNIVAILAVNQDQQTKQHFIVMEFVEGGNLRDILQIRKKMELEEALRVMEECAAGLAYAHSCGLTHRDIKPTNVLISTDKTAKLVDFGLAEVSHGSGQMFSDKMPDRDNLEVDRTVDYAGLEKLTNQKKGDFRSDIYFLGTVFFEMLTGHAVLPPTRDRGAMTNRRRYELEDQVRRLAAEHRLPSAVTSLILRMVAFDPGQRFQTAAAMLEAVRAARADLGGEKGRDTAPKVTGPPTIFVVESNAKLQDVFRHKFRKMGFRVLMSIDPAQASKRFKEQPFHAALIDAGTVSREGVEAFERLQRDAAGIGFDLAAVLILNEDQAGWAGSVVPSENSAVYVRPVTMKQISDTYRRLLGTQLADEEAGEGE